MCQDDITTSGACMCVSQSVQFIQHLPFLGITFWRSHWSELEILTLSDVLQHLLFPHLQVHLEEVYQSQDLHLHNTVMDLLAWVPDDDGFCN